jgi:peptidoglycan/LPS O-acetylase OafA/YrhL
MTTSSKITERETSFLRALAILLIINSHLDNYYPVRHLATGGMIGNSLFFMLSALGLYLSWQKRRTDGFGTWYGRRILRIYPAVWISALVILFPIAIHEGQYRPDALLDYMGVFFYPPFWFLQSLMIFYIVLYFILKSHSQRLFVCVSVAAAAIYSVYYIFFLDLGSFSIEDHPFKIIFYFMLMLWGLHLASRIEHIRYAGFLDVVFLGLCILGIYGHKYMMYLGNYSSMQFVQQLLVFPLLFYSLKVSRHNAVADRIMNDQYISGKVLGFLSGLTLELYLVNYVLQNKFYQLMSFPWNLALFLGVNLLLAVLIHYASNKTRNLLEKYV